MHDNHKSVIELQNLWHKEVIHQKGDGCKTSWTIVGKFKENDCYFSAPGYLNYFILELRFWEIELTFNFILFWISILCYRMFVMVWSDQVMLIEYTVFIFTRGVNDFALSVELPSAMKLNSCELEICVIRACHNTQS